MWGHPYYREKAGIIYLPLMIKFVIFEFIFAINDTKFARRGVENKFIKYKIGGLFFYHSPLA